MEYLLIRATRAVLWENVVSIFDRILARTKNRLKEYFPKWTGAEHKLIRYSMNCVSQSAGFPPGNFFRG